jgi:CRP-like cAMP-binding protein
MNDLSRTRVLARCPLFADLPERDLAELAAVAQLRRFGKGQVVFSEGEDADTLLVVQQGLLKATSGSAEGENFLLAVAEPGDSLGELIVADGGPRSATVTAVTDAQVLSLRRADVLRVADTSPALTRALLVAMATVVRRLTGSAADLVFLDIPRRVAKLLLDLPAGGVVLTQLEMADRVGASRQSLNAALQDFQRRGWITVARRAVDVRDRAALRRFAGV